MDKRFEEHEHEAALMQGLKDSLVIHNLPPVQLGSGRTSVGHKFQALMHMIKIVSPTLTLLPHCARSCVVLTSDYGVEARVPSVKPVPVSEVFPYLQEDDYSDNESDTDSDMPVLVDPQDDFVCEPSPEPMPAEDDDFKYVPQPRRRRDRREELLDLSGCSEIPGLLHVIHNAGKALSEQLTHYNEAAEKLQATSNMLRRRESKERLKETCFSSDIGRAVWDQCLKSFKGKCYSERWGTVANCLHLMSSDVKASLDFYWDVTKYRGSTSERKPDPEEEDADVMERIHIIDEALRNPFWWAMWDMLSRVAKILRLALIWAEGCPCHDQLRLALAELAPGDNRPFIKEMHHVANSCVMRGRRCPELAAGDFEKVMKRLYTEEASALLMQLPPALSGKERKEILQDFERSRQYLLSTFILKLSHWIEDGHAVFAIAHHDPAVAWARYKAVMECTAETELIKELKSPELGPDRLYFESLEGALPETEDPSDAPLLRQFLGKLRLARSAERSAEGLHATIHKEVRRAPNHTTPLVSLVNRFSQIREYVTAKPTNCSRFAQILSTCVNGRTACNMLGFRNHPATQALTGGRDVNGFEIMYRGDAYSKYQMSKPMVDFSHSQAVPATGAMLT